MVYTIQQKLEPTYPYYMVQWRTRLWLSFAGPIKKKNGYVQCFAFANPINSYRINESSNTKIYWSSCEKASSKV